MPTVHNGIGTWYYGRRRIHRRKGTCPFCKRLVEQQSYDTTLYIVVFFVPLIPLGQKRVLDQCAVCGRHRVISLKKWEEGKAADIARLLEKLKQDPDDRDTILSGLALAGAYQDPVLLDKLADSLARHRTDDPAIQNQLGVAYAYFARQAEAEAAFRAALAVDDGPGIRQRLALSLLKQSRPREALPYLRHIMDEKLQEDAGMLTVLVEGYQAEGLHQEALEIMDQRDEAFPALATAKEWAKQRKTSERYQLSGKRVRPTYLSESPRAGYHEGSWTATIPRIIGPVVVLGLLAWYLGTALWLGQARQVYLVNGSDRPYTVAVNGREYQLAANAATPVRVREGDVTVALRDGNPPPEPIHCRVETPFFSRPFVGHTFVINPDQVAVLVRQEEIYAENPVPSPPSQIHLGQAFYAFDGIDCEFTPLPTSVSVSEGGQVRKTAVELMPNLPTEVRLRVVGQALGAPAQEEYARHLLDRNPNDVLALQFLIDRLGQDEALTLLRSRLGDRPLLMDWHRAYQTYMEKAHPEHDLRPEYRKLVEESGQQPDALYLLARVLEDDPDGSERLLRQAATTDPPSAYALHGLGYRALEQGQFDEAVRWTTRAVELAPDNVALRDGNRTALLAAGRYQPLLEQFQRQQQQPGQKLGALVGQIRVFGMKGDEAQARGLVAEALQVAADPHDPAGRDRVEASLEMVLAYARHDPAKYLEAADRIADASQFEPALLRGKLQEAAHQVHPEPDQAVVQHALLYLAATKAGEENLAEEQWSALLAGLNKGHGAKRPLGEMLAGRQPLQAERVRRMPIGAEQKRVLLAVVARRYPETAGELLPLARKLDFQADATSLCFRKILE